MPSAQPGRSAPRWRAGVCLGLVALLAVGCAAKVPDAVKTGMSASCMVAFKVSAKATPPPQTAMDRTVRTCASYDDWQLGLGLHPGLLSGADPVDYLIARCTDPTADLSGFAVCRTLAIALTTPGPTVAPTPSMEPAKRTPRPTAGHQARPTHRRTAPPTH